MSADDEAVVVAAAASPHLDSLLSKLRPFQRTAFEFAVNGRVAVDPPSSNSNGGEDGGENVKNDGNNNLPGCEEKEKKKKKRKSAPPPRGGAKKGSSTKKVAGAGTGRILLGDEMGLGKTLTSLAIMLAYQRTEWPLLILCPASLRYTWPAEIEKFCPWIPSQSIHVVRGKDDVHFAAQIHRWRNQRRQRAGQSESHAHPPEEEKASNTNKSKHSKQSKCPVQIVIVTYSLLQNRFQIANVLRDCEFECIIADESHNLKQKSSQRCQLALPLLHGSKRLTLLSGTPALNRPVELWPQLNALDPGGEMFGDDDGRRMSYTEYTKRYCNARRTRFGWDIKGVSNADELHRCLKSVMVRRLKSDVLGDLPSKQRSIVPVTISDREKERESRETMAQLRTARQAVSEITDLDADDVADSAQWEARKLLMRAYQASGAAKAPATTEYILDWLEGSDSSQKLVVFAHHKEVLDYVETTISKKYKGRLGIIRIDGSVPPAERALRVKKFQTNKTVRLAVLSMTAAGVGLTLTAASNIVFAELHWTPGVLAQAEDRCHRIGQTNCVNVMYCICKDEEVSVDSQLWAMLGRKVGNLGRVVDGERVKLNAVEREAGEPSGDEKKKNVSVEEELSSFFSSASVSTGAKQSKGPVVKGTIQSFFKKQAKKVEPAKAPSTPNTEKTPKLTMATTCISLLDDDGGDNDENVMEVKKSPVQVTSLISDDTRSNTTVFICHVCTFENRLDVSTCTVCNTARSSNTPTGTTDDERVDLASTPSTQDWQCRVCTYINPCERTSCGMCNASHQPQQPAKGGRSEAEPGDSDNAHSDDSGPSKKSKSIICEEDEFDDDEWNEEDIEAIDLVTQQHNTISQSPDCYNPPSNSNDNSQKCCMPRECAPKPQTESGTRDILSFSVSRNSGRLALHLSSSGKPLHVNFDITQVLTKESADLLEESNMLRKAQNSSVAQSERSISFDDGAIKQVLVALDSDAILPATLSFRESLGLMCQELKQFVRCYLSLREVEKKAVKESGEAIASSFLKQTVAKLIVSTVTGSTERYLGGAKERAIEALKNNRDTSEDRAVINGQACAWCAKPFLCSKNNGATYCSQTCVEEGRVRRGGMYSSSKIREQLFALEHGVCTMCNIDAHSLFTRIKALHPAERLNALLNAKWKLPKTRQAVDRLLSDPKESDFWQADHEVAVAEGGGSTGLDNLRTLCNPCHSGETEKLLARLKTTMQGTQPDVPAKDGRTQMDIISCFSQMTGDRSLEPKRKKKRRRVAD